MLVGQVSERTDRPAYVRFERVAKENKALSLQEGKFVATDVDYALITPPYSKDVIRQKVASWFDNLEQDVRNDRIPEAMGELYRDAYRSWQNGQEIPPNGSPIRGWGVLSPAQQENLLRINILTVEDLAGVNDEGLRRVGMGAQELKQKAVAWLRTLHDRGPLTQENAALKSANDNLLMMIETLTEQNRLLRGNIATPVAEEAISANELLDEDEPATKIAPGKRK